MIGQSVVGTPDSIADEPSRRREAVVDGINLIDHRLPSSYEEFIALVLPGAAAARPGHDRLPAARFRGAFGDREQAVTGAGSGPQAASRSSSGRRW